MKNIIEIKSISKTFSDIKAVSDLSFRVKEGELFAFLGVNGAGKSTTINMICGDLSIDSGEVYIDGLELHSNLEIIKRKIGVVFQNCLLDLPLSVYDNLASRAALYGIVGEEFKSRLNELSKLLDLKDLLNRKLKNLSGGQRRRIDIARALLHKPQILVLDEPTTGLDPQTRKMIWNVVSKLQKEENMTVFLTTHYMEEASDADYVVIIDGGKISAKGTPLELKNEYTGDFIVVYSVSKEDIEQLGVNYVEVKDGYKIFVSNTEEATKLIIQYPNIFIDYEVIKGKMDDVFLAVTGKKLVGGAL